MDDAEELDSAWFDGCESVLISAGASAPEELVQQCVAELDRRFGAAVEHHSIREEDVVFPLTVGSAIGAGPSLPSLKLCASRSACVCIADRTAFPRRIGQSALRNDDQDYWSMPPLGRLHLGY